MRNPKKHLSFKSLRQLLSNCFLQIKEHRQLKKTDYSLHDAFMCGFACMYFQDPSLLQFQERLQKTRHKDNLQTLFGVKKIPESTQLRRLIDAGRSDHLAYFFKAYFHQLQRAKYLEQYALFPGDYLLSLDATHFFSSDALSCEGCLRTERQTKSSNKKKGEDVEAEVLCKNETHITYGHKALQVALMHPDRRQVIPLMPEPICNTDGHSKQDCEINAAKRLVPKLRKTHPQLGIILAGDDLFSRQPFIEEVLAARMHYIFAAKPESHTYLMDWLAAYPKLHQKEVREKKKKEEIYHYYEWMNDVPLHGEKKAIRVNYFRYTVYKLNATGEKIQVYKNSWVSDIAVSEENVVTLSRGGRCRWKIENECFNTLKNQGYCIDHNYGHGNKNLCFNFYLLTLMAFSFHQVFELTDKLYQTCRKAFGSKRNLWEHIRAYVRLWAFDTWESLLNFTLNPEDYLPERPP